MLQKALYFMEYLRITQGENGKTSHLGTLATDHGGKDTGASKLYAPCDIKIIRVRNGGSHEIYAESLQPVETPSGRVDYVHFTFMHDNYINSNCKAGAAIQQGQHFADEGGYGYGRVNAFAIHNHCECGFGKSPAYQTQNRYGTWYTPNQAHIYDVLFLPADCIVLNGAGYPWKRTTDKLLDISQNAEGGHNGSSTQAAFIPYNVQPLYKLNVRSGPGTDRAKTGLFALPKYRYTVKEAVGSWGRTPIGWIYLPYTRKAA